MIELLKDWLMGITCAAMVAALAEAMTPKGPVRTVGRLVGGLVLLLAVVQPVLQSGASYGGPAMAAWKSAGMAYTAEVEGENMELVKKIIAQRTGAYIQDKAAELGIHCTVTVETEVGDEGYGVPTGVVVEGELTATQRRELTALISEDLAIGEERQRYRGAAS